MSINTETIKRIQAETSGRLPIFVQQGTTISAANSPPASATDGVSVLDSSSQSAVLSEVLVLLDTATDVDLVLWGWRPTLGAWAQLEGTSVEEIGNSWSVRVLTGTVTRLYVEILSTDGDLDVYVGPCEGA
jgi:hypothetical protein